MTPDSNMLHHLQNTPLTLKFCLAFATLVILTILTDLGAAIGIVALAPDADSSLGSLLLLAQFSLDFVVLWIIARIFYDHGLAKLFYQPLSDNLRPFAICFAIFAVVLGGGQWLSFDPSLHIPNLPVDEWLRWFPLALPLILIQITAEELTFRGFLQQKLAAISQNRLVWMVLPSVIFGLLHYDPSQPGWDAWYIVGNLTLISIFLADITHRTGNIGAALGWHFINNIVSLCFVAPHNSGGLALYVWPVPTEPFGALILIQPIILLALYFFIFRRWVR